MRIKKSLVGAGLGSLVAFAAVASMQAGGRGRRVPVPGSGPDPASALEAVPGEEPRPLCQFLAGSLARDTVPGVAAAPPRLPIEHVIILMQENRSFDHYFGQLSTSGQLEAEAIPASFGNPDAHGGWVRPFHLDTTCIPHDPPHQWESMRAHWNRGRMDRFVIEAARRGGPSAAGDSSHASLHRGRRSASSALGGDVDDDEDDATSGGRFTLGYFDDRDLPFYYHLANTFTIADRYFSAAMAGTWPNRQFLYTGTAQKRLAPTAMLRGVRTLFDTLDAARVPWAVYTDGPARQDCIGWAPRAPGVLPIHELFAALRRGTLPAVSFVDPADEDEHPPADVQRGEGWARRLYLALAASPQWRQTVLFLTYDEGGGFFDHVPPPAACPPSPDRAEYDRRGTRVPLLVVSPWARRHAVSHVVHDHASLLRFIELLFDLPALSARDANADALLDAFDFESPPRLDIPSPPPAGRGGCRPLKRQKPAAVAARSSLDE